MTCHVFNRSGNSKAVQEDARFIRWLGDDFAAERVQRFVFSRPSLSLFIPLPASFLCHSELWSIILVIANGKNCVTASSRASRYARLGGYQLRSFVWSLSNAYIWVPAPTQRTLCSCDRLGAAQTALPTILARAKQISRVLRHEDSVVAGGVVLHRGETSGTNGHSLTEYAGIREVDARL